MFLTHCEKCKSMPEEHKNTSAEKSTEALYHLLQNELEHTEGGIYAQQNDALPAAELAA